MCQCEPFDHLPNSLNLAAVNRAAIRLQPYLNPTPLEKIDRLSVQTGVDVLFKREDMQPVRSFKARGALNKLLKLRESGQRSDYVCASAGNHAQGFAWACRLLNSQGVVFLPKNTPAQKVQQVRYFGGDMIKVRFHGQNFDSCSAKAQDFAAQTGAEFIHPFDDEDIICGQGTLAVELVSSLRKAPDSVFIPVGGGGLASGVALVLRALWPDTRLIGVEVAGSEAMARSRAAGRSIQLSYVDSFADGTAVRQVGDLGFQVCSALLDDVIVVSPAEVVQAIYKLNNEYGMVVEPSGALSLAGLQHQVRRGQSAVCIISGGNNDAGRFAEFQSILKGADIKKPA